MTNGPPGIILDIRPTGDCRVIRQSHDFTDPPGAERAAPGEERRFHLKKKVLKVLQILFGNFVLSICASHFIIPGKLISGGITGLSLAGHSIFTGLPLDVFVWGFSLVFLLIGLIFLGKEFFFSTLLSSVAYPLFFTLMSRVGRAYLPLTDDIVLNMVYAGLTFGLGVGIVVRTGASTGGADVFAMILNKKFGLPVSPLVYITEALILVTQIPFFSSEQILYGLLMVLIYSITLEKAMIFGAGKIQIMIYSKEHEAINAMILKKMNRGSTRFHVQGGFTGEETEVVSTVIPKRSLFSMREQILAIDPKAFVVVTPISEVNGRGFTMNKNA